MVERLVTLDAEQDFLNIIEAERQTAEAVFANNIDIIDSAISPEAEAGLNTITMGKTNGCQDTGGGGYEWEKVR